MAVEALLLTTLILAAVTVVMCAFILRSARGSSSALSEVRLAQLEQAIGGVDRSVRDEFVRNRDESGKDAKSLRDELGTSFGALGNALRQSLSDLSATQNTQLEGFATRLGTVTVQITELTSANERRQETLRTNVETKLGELKSDATRSAKDLREEVSANLKNVGEGLKQGVEQISRTQKERLDNLSQSITTLSLTVEGRLDAIRTENAAKLEEMRKTVDEKLQSTLEQRLDANFRQVSDSLERLHKSAGEMNALATDVGDLKRVLTNVKSRGTWGEVALGTLLEQVMAPDQYGKNVEIQPGRRVEYALRLPGDDETPVWLPIDAKFPTEDYERLVQAAERADAEGIEAAARAVETRIRAAAREIAEKYVHPPMTTDFAVLFLPTEGLFAEVMRRPGLVDVLQRECRVTVTGPTTLWSMLTAFRMGFRSLAIQKRSQEVWRVLGAVKTEFAKFGTVMDGVSKKLEQAQNAIDVEVRRRTKAMNRSLKGVESLPETDAQALLRLNGAATATLVEDEEDRDAPEQA